MSPFDLAGWFNISTVGDLSPGRSLAHGKWLTWQRPLVQRGQAALASLVRAKTRPDNMLNLALVYEQN